MTATDELTDNSPGEPSAPGSGSPRVVREVARRRKAARRKRRATSVVAALTVVFVVAVVVLGLVGWRATMRITGGQELKITDPAAPGYTAEAKPTDVQLLALTNSDGSLATMLMLSGGAGLAEPVAVPVSAGLVVWEFEDAGPATVRDLFSDAGVDVVALRLGVDLTFGIESSAVMPIADMEPLFRAMGPIDVELPDIVYSVDETGERTIHYPAGPMTLEPDQVAEFLSFTGDGEAELNRGLRIKPVWEKIIAAYRSNPDVIKTESEVSENVPLWGELAESKNKNIDVDKLVQLVPTKVIPLYTSPPVYLDQVDGDAIPAWISSYVPFPSAAFPGQRVVVNLLNGTTDNSVLQRVSPRIISSGGTIGMTGNASSFDVATTEVTYSNPAADERAQAMAAELGTTATKVELLPSGVDVQVTVGKDLL
ncbi:MAG: LytR C-terminal domain-containing protein [Microthrixaceae bacterium]|nr:LytR C-terminal domain-containing protein [Microthrixaceae bacterium]